MSHSTVMVIGPTTEAELSDALAPFDENSEVDPYFSPMSWGLDKRHDDESLEEFAARLTKEWEEEHFVQDVNGVPTLGTMSTYPPDSKWDWWQIGGRWRGSLPLKAGVSGGALGEPGVFDNDVEFEGGVDVARLGDIDFELKRTNAESRAKAAWEQIDEALDGRFLPPLPREETREAYQAWWNDPVVEDVMTAIGNQWGMHPRDLTTMVDDPAAYITHSGKDAVCCFATLHEGEWIEPGAMGWFGMSSDTPESRDEYVNKVHELLTTLPDDTMIWVVDYHI